MSTANGSTNGTHSASSTDVDLDVLYAWMPGLSPAPAPLPEAPASVNVRVQIAGREVQWTLRDHDEARLAVRLDALLARYPVPQAPTPPAQRSPLRLAPIALKTFMGLQATTLSGFGVLFGVSFDRIGICIFSD